MNPFDLYGPQFLFFFIVLMAVMLTGLHLLRQRLEQPLTAGPEPVLYDPYAIAYLRGGKPELLRVAVISLVDRGLLHVSNANLATTQVGRETQTRKRLEQDLLRYCHVVRTREELYQTPELDVGVQEYAYVLETHKLVADEEIAQMRRWLFGPVAILLVAVAIAKIAIALSRGRTNVMFLIVLAVIAVVSAWKIAFPRRTVRGAKFLADLQNVFQSLKLRAPTLRPGGANADLVLAIAVFGIDILPQGQFGWAYELYPPNSSSSSSSCGSGCGGGGCGGGCGGCGG